MITVQGYHITEINMELGSKFNRNCHQLKDFILLQVNCNSGNLRDSYHFYRTVIYLI